MEPAFIPLTEPNGSTYWLNLALVERIGVKGEVTFLSIAGSTYKAMETPGQIFEKFEAS